MSTAETDAQAPAQSDADIAADVRAAVSALNRAIQDACLAGLTVHVKTSPAGSMMLAQGALIDIAPEVEASIVREL